jgi:hypothetical protein
MESEIEYKTAAANSSETLDKAVNQALGEGYELYGPPYGSGGTFCQALKRSKEPKHRTDCLPESFPLSN